MDELTARFILISASPRWAGLVTIKVWRSTRSASYIIYYRETRTDASICMWSMERETQASVQVKAKLFRSGFMRAEYLDPGN